MKEDRIYESLINGLDHLLEGIRNEEAFESQLSDGNAWEILRHANGDYFENSLNEFFTEVITAVSHLSNKDSLESFYRILIAKLESEKAKGMPPARGSGPDPMHMYYGPFVSEFDGEQKFYYQIIEKMVGREDLEVGYNELHDLASAGDAQDDFKSSVSERFFFIALKYGVNHALKYVCWTHVDSHWDWLKELLKDHNLWKDSYAEVGDLDDIPAYQEIMEVSGYSGKYLKLYLLSPLS